jgi:hypothetical protein
MQHVTWTLKDAANLPTRNTNFHYFVESPEGLLLRHRQSYIFATKIIGDNVKSFVKILDSPAPEKVTIHELAHRNMVRQMAIVVRVPGGEFQRLLRDKNQFSPVGSLMSAGGDDEEDGKESDDDEVEMYEDSPAVVPFTGTPSEAEHHNAGALRAVLGFLPAGPGRIIMMVSEGRCLPLLVHRTYDKFTFQFPRQCLVLHVWPETSSAEIGWIKPKQCPFGINGPGLLRIVDEINKAMGVHYASLQDDSKVEPCGQVVSLAMLKTLEKDETFYQKYGWKPVSDMLQGQLDDTYISRQVLHFEKKHNQALVAFFDVPVEERMQQVAPNTNFDYGSITTWHDVVAHLTSREDSQECHAAAAILATLDDLYDDADREWIFPVYHVKVYPRKRKFSGTENVKKTHPRKEN